MRTKGTSDFHQRPKGITHCKRCNKELTKKQKINRQLYCSRECSQPPIKFKIICPQCNKAYLPIDRSKVHMYCSRKCLCEAKRLNHLRNNKNYIKQTNKIKRIYNKLRKCNFCNNIFILDTKIHKLSALRLSKKRVIYYCYDEICRKEFYKRKSFLYAKKRHINKKIKCDNCGKLFIIEYGSKKRKFCSKKCMTNYHDWMRHIKERASKKNIIELPNRYQIFERDNFKCHICNKKINMKLNHPHPLSATLDHIIPISQGGKHSAKNLKPAHLECNSIKGNRTLTQGEQLLMFG